MGEQTNGTATDQRERLVERAAGALVGLAIGDLYGSAAWGMPPEEAAGVVQGYDPGAGPAWISDVTEYVVLVARALLAGGGRVQADAFRDTLSSWVAGARQHGRAARMDPELMAALDAPNPELGLPASPGASTSAALSGIPLGIAVSFDPMSAIPQAAAEMRAATPEARVGGGRPTRLAVAGCAAAAYAVSSHLAGAAPEQIIPLAMTAADQGGALGAWGSGPDLAARMGWAGALAGQTEGEPGGVIDLLVGTGPAVQEGLPAALALAVVHPTDGLQAVRAAAACGGDSARLAGLTGAFVGARDGVGVWPPELRAAIENANPDLRLTELATRLVELRLRGAQRVAE